MGISKTLRIEYDLSSQPYSIGDVLVFNERSLFFDEPIDFVFTFDPNKPAVPDPAFQHITTGNFLQHIEKLVPIAWCNPKIRSVEVMSHDALTGDRWPRTRGKYLFYDCMAEIAKHGPVPLQWKQPCPDFGDYVSVQLRRNPRNPGRDSDFDAWIEFFRTTDDNFVVIGEPSEMDDRLRLSNVTLTKDYNLNAAQDLGVILNSRCHMGAGSGPACVAWFNDKPYCVFNTAMGENFCEGYEFNGGRARFTWSKPKQTLIYEKETAGALTYEHASLQ